MRSIRAFAYLLPAASSGRQEEKPMESHSVVVLVIGAAMFVIALVGLMAKPIELGQK